MAEIGDFVRDPDIPHLLFGIVKAKGKIRGSQTPMLLIEQRGETTFIADSPDLIVQEIHPEVLRILEEMKAETPESGA